MEENVNIAQEAADTVTTADAVAADQPDAFLDGFDDAETVAEADRPAETEVREETEAQGAAEANAEAKPETEEGAGGSEAEAHAEKSEAQKEQTWIVRHMDTQREMTAKDITPELLQKGLDYDRVRGKYDEQKPVMEIFSQLARKAGMSVSDFAKAVREEAKKAQGMNAQDAKRAVELEDREAAVSAAEAKDKAAKNAQDQRTAKIRADLAEFAQAFPDVYKKAGGDPKNAIPKQVWDDVNRGFSLTAAYARYVAAEASRQAAAAAEQAKTAGRNAENAERSTGSQRSAGNDAKNKDPFLEGFDG